MKKFDVQIALEGIAEASAKWRKAKAEFQQGVDTVMARLIHEAAVNYMSVEEVARYSGLTAAKVHDLMRKHGLNRKNGKRMLADHAAKALAENAELMGIEPHQMDLTSPLAYLPMGKELRQALTDRTVSKVTELPGSDCVCVRDANGNVPIAEKGCWVHDLRVSGNEELVREILNDAAFDIRVAQVSGNAEEDAADIVHYAELAERYYDMLVRLGFCPKDGEAMPCTACGAGL